MKERAEPEWSLNWPCWRAKPEYQCLRIRIYMRTKRNRKTEQVGNRLSNNREKSNTIASADHLYMSLGAK